MVAPAGKTCISYFVRQKRNFGTRSWAISCFFCFFFIGDYFQLILHFKFHGRFIIDNTYFNFEMNFLLWAFFLGGGGVVLEGLYIVYYLVSSKKSFAYQSKYYDLDKPQDERWNANALCFLLWIPPKSMCSSLRTVCYISAPVVYSSHNICQCHPQSKPV